MSFRSTGAGSGQRLAAFVGEIPLAVPHSIRWQQPSRHDLIAEPFDHRCARIIETEMGDKVPFAAWYGILMS